MSHSNSSICQGSSRSCGRPDRPRTSLPCKCSASLTSGNYRLYYTMAGLRKSKGHQMDRRTFVYASLSSLLTYNCSIAHARANLHGCRMAAKAVESLGYKLIEPPSPRNYRDILELRFGYYAGSFGHQSTRQSRFRNNPFGKD
jgi:hypothetical protein